MIPIGLSVSTGIIIGNLIGGMQLKCAHFYGKMCLLTGLMWAIASVIAVFAFEDLWITIFSSDPIVNDYIRSAYLILVIYVFFDCMQQTVIGMIRGLGK